jgi:hypothetical protein
MGLPYMVLIPIGVKLYPQARTIFKCCTDKKFAV